MPKKFETAVNPQTDKNERVPENVSKYQHYHIIISVFARTNYDYNCNTWLWDNDCRNMISLKELRKNQDESYTVKTNEHMQIGFALAIYYLKDIEHENDYFCYIVKGCVVMFPF